MPRRDVVWRNNLNAQMRQALSGDPDFVAYRVVGRVVRGEPVEALTASGASQTAYLPRDAGAPVRETVAIFHRTVLSTQAQALTASWKTEDEA